LISKVVWLGGDLPLMELATLWRTTQGHALRGSVVGRVADTELALRYDVGCTPTWETRTVRVEMDAPPERRRILVDVDETGAWTIDGVAKPELSGIRDVDIEVTPSTNTLPIRRLALGVGEQARVTAAWIRVPSLEVFPLRQSYARLAGDRYEYRAEDFRAELVVDRHGLVEEYGSFWRRLR
jgi:hypothetical protein